MRQQNPFDQFMTDTLTLKKKDGRSLEGIKASVQSKGIAIPDANLPLDAGDCLFRTLPNGSVEEFFVDDPGYQSGFGLFPLSLWSSTKSAALLVDGRLCPKPRLLNLANFIQRLRR